jgi:hypothetical protein
MPIPRSIIDGEITMDQVAVYQRLMLAEKNAKETELFVLRIKEKKEKLVPVEQVKQMLDLIAEEVNNSLEEIPRWAEELGVDFFENQTFLKEKVTLIKERLCGVLKLAVGLNEEE